MRAKIIVFIMFVSPSLCFWACAPAGIYPVVQPPETPNETLFILDERPNNQQQMDLITKADDQFNQGNYEEALRIYQELLAQGLDTWGIHHQIGKCLYLLGRFEDALASFEKANSLRENSISYNWMGWSYLKMKEYEKAIKTFEKSQGLASPQSSDPTVARSNHEGLGAAYYWLGKHDEAISHSTKALESAPTEDKKKQIKYDLAFTHAAKGDYEQAYYLLAKRSTIGIWVRKGSQGFLVDLVHKNGPADLAGIKEGDEIVEFEGEPLGDVTLKRFTEEMIANASFGSTVRLRIFRTGTYLDRSVIVGVLPNLPELAMKAQDTETASPAEETAEKRAEPSLRLLKIEVRPDAVSPGGSFNLIIEYTAEDPSLKREAMAVRFTYSILEGNRVVLEPQAVELKSKSGDRVEYTQPLFAANKQGTYRIKVNLIYGTLVAEASKELIIRQE